MESNEKQANKNILWNLGLHFLIMYILMNYCMGINSVHVWFIPDLAHNTSTLNTFYEESVSVHQGKIYLHRVERDLGDLLVQPQSTLRYI